MKKTTGDNFEQLFNNEWAPLSMQNAHRKRKIVVLSCPKLSFKMKKTTWDNYTKSNDLFGGTKKSDYLCNVIH